MNTQDLNNEYDSYNAHDDFELDYTEEDRIEHMQSLIDSGVAWRLEGAIGREAMALIDNGQCMLGEQGWHDTYGNYVPSRTEVEPGTKGSPEFVEAQAELV